MLNSEEKSCWPTILSKISSADVEIHDSWASLVNLRPDLSFHGFWSLYFNTDLCTLEQLYLYDTATFLNVTSVDNEGGFYDHDYIDIRPLTLLG